ncbi:hypothetical protein A9Q77_07275 [Marinomonas sp. 42_23_T18]|nr:hypothetical protein A9Q77_07275 [Marinomonas sp. 42_23_T18]
MNMSDNKGMVPALSAYILWGIAPIYFKWMADENPLDIIANRVLWSVILLAIVISVMGKWGNVKAALSSMKTVRTLLATTLLIAVNWSVFIYAIATDRMLDASLGYYINPLLSVTLAYFFLNERLNKMQVIALVLAVVGVSIQVFELGYLPWISILLASSFGFYGLFHKKTPTDSFTSLFVETSLLLPIALAVMTYLYGSSIVISDRDSSTWLMFMLAGPVTTLPLLLFSMASKTVKLSTLGFLQYIGPTMILGLAIFVYGEVLEPAKGLTFIFIWAGLFLYGFDSVRRDAKRRKQLKN